MQQLHPFPLKAEFVARFLEHGLIKKINLFEKEGRSLSVVGGRVCSAQLLRAWFGTIVYVQHEKAGSGVASGSKVRGLEGIQAAGQAADEKAWIQSGASRR